MLPRTWKSMWVMLVGIVLLIVVSVIVRPLLEECIGVWPARLVAMATTLAMGFMVGWWSADIDNRHEDDE